MIYIASPYSHPNPDVRHERFQSVTSFVAQLTAKGLPAFSPITYAHQIAIHHELPTDAQFWLRFNTAFLRQSSSMFILRLDGWKESKGISLEQRLCEVLNIPIRHFNTNFQPIK